MNRRLLKALALFVFVCGSLAANARLSFASEIPRPEYPRPEMVRAEWFLNG
jgi:hypothetical protein